MKKIILSLVLLVLFLSGCTTEKKPEINNYQIAVVRTTEKIERSTILFYNQDLELLGEMEIPYGGLGHEASGRRLWQIGNHVTLVPHGLMGDYDTRKVLSFNSETLDYEVFSIDRSNIGYAVQSENYIYATSNLNGISYLSQHSLLDGSLREVSYDQWSEFAWDLNVTSNYVFVTTLVEGEYNELTRQDDSFSQLYIYNNNLEIARKIDLLKEGYGDYITHGTEYNGFYYFPTSYTSIIDGEEYRQGRLLKLDLNTLEIEVINLTERGPNQVEVYGDKLVVLHYYYGEDDPASLTVYDPQTEEIVNNIEFDGDLQRFAIEEDLLYGLVYNGKTYSRSLVTYDLNTLQRKGILVLPVEETEANQYYTGLFVRNKE